MPSKPPSSTRSLIRSRLRAHVDGLRGADPRISGDDRSASVHDLRVAIRRLRSDLRTFRPVLERDWSTELGEELSWWSDALGEVRDAEVLLAVVSAQARRLPESDRVAAADLGGYLVDRRDMSQLALRGLLDSDRYVALVETLTEAARSPHVELDGGERRARDLTPVLARRAWTRLRDEVRSLPEVPTPAQLHHVRIRAKRARYAAETAAVVRPKGHERLADRLAALQDHLGRHHDAVLAQAWLSAHTALHGRDELAFVAGELAGLVRADELRLAASWRPLWREAKRAASALH